MSNIQTRNTVVALKVESTEGTPVSPTAAGDYIAAQDDFTLTPGFETLENAELTSSLGPSKPVQGLENPAGSFSHYLRNSGTVGTAPNYGDLLQAALGTEAIASTEYDTVSGSTTTVINVDSGEGAQFSRGDLLLIKDATNGFSIRPVHSISSDALTLGFAIANAPGTGVNLGRATMYRPANSDHQTVTVWRYLGNGGVIDAVSGARVVDTSLTMEAGQFINASYSFEGIKSFWNPLEVTTSNNKLDFDDGGGEENVSITAKMYRDPYELAQALEDAMNEATTDTITVTYNDADGKFTLESDGATFELLWSTGTNGSGGTDEHIGTLIGFVDSADDTGATSYEADNALDLSAPQTPSYDSADPLVAKSNTILIGDQSDSTCIEASSVSVSIATPKADILSVCADSGKSGSVINARTVTVEVTALLEQYQADYFRRLRQNSDTRFFYAFGEKEGGNWVAGKAGGVYIPTATVTGLEVADEDGLAVLNLSLQAYVDSSGNGEVYIGFV